MDELKRQMMEAVAALDAHDAETDNWLERGPVGSNDWKRRNDQRARLVTAVAGVARTMVAHWKAEENGEVCGAALAGHLCGVRGPHDTHEDKRTLLRWPVTP